MVISVISVDFGDFGQSCYRIGVGVGVRVKVGVGRGGGRIGVGFYFPIIPASYVSEQFVKMQR